MLEIIKLILVILNAFLFFFNHYSFWKTEQIKYGINCIVNLITIVIVLI